MLDSNYYLIWTDLGSITNRIYILFWVKMMKTKLFKSGNSLAIRVPKKFASLFSNNLAQINFMNHKLIIKPINEDWDEIFSKCYKRDFPAREAMNLVDRESLGLD